MSSNLNQREAALRAAMANATLAEKRQIAAELDRINAQRLAKRESANELNMARTAVRNTLSPVLVHGMHTADTDWIGEQVKTAYSKNEMSDIQREAQVEASKWFRSVSAAVRAYPDEFSEQARGFAHRTASQYGTAAPSVKSAILSHIASLYRTAEGTDAAGIESAADGETNPEATPWSEEMSLPGDDAPANEAPEGIEADVYEAEWDDPAPESFIEGGDEFSSIEEPESVTATLWSRAARQYLAAEEGTTPAQSPAEVDEEQSGEAGSTLPREVSVTDATDSFPNFMERKPAADASSERAKNISANARRRRATRKTAEWMDGYTWADRNGRKPKVGDVDSWDVLYESGDVRVEEASNIGAFYRVKPSNGSSKTFFGESAWSDAERYASDIDFQAWGCTSRINGTPRGSLTTNSKRKTAYGDEIICYWVDDDPVLGDGYLHIECATRLNIIDAVGADGYDLVWGVSAESIASDYEESGDQLAHSGEAPGWKNSNLDCQLCGRPVATIEPGEYNYRTRVDRVYASKRKTAVSEYFVQVLDEAPHGFYAIYYGPLQSGETQIMPLADQEGLNSLDDVEQSFMRRYLGLERVGEWENVQVQDSPRLQCSVRQTTEGYTGEKYSKRKTASTGFSCKQCGAESPVGVGYKDDGPYPSPDPDCINYHIVDGEEVSIAPSHKASRRRATRKVAFEDEFFGDDEPLALMDNPYYDFCPMCYDEGLDKATGMCVECGYTDYNTLEAAKRRQRRAAKRRRIAAHDEATETPAEEAAESPEEQMTEEQETPSVEARRRRAYIEPGTIVTLDGERAVISHGADPGFVYVNVLPDGRREEWAESTAERIIAENGGRFLSKRKTDATRKAARRRRAMQGRRF